MSSKPWIFWTSIPCEPSSCLERGIGDPFLVDNAAHDDFPISITNRNLVDMPGQMSGAGLAPLQSVHLHGWP